MAAAQKQLTGSDGKNWNGNWWEASSWKEGCSNSTWNTTSGWHDQGNHQHGVRQPPQPPPVNQPAITPMTRKL